MATIATFYGIIIPIVCDKDLVENGKLAGNGLTVFNVEPAMGKNILSFSVSATKIVFLPSCDSPKNG